MSERIPSDHSSVTTGRGRVERSGGTRRPCLRLPDEFDLDAGDVIRLSLDGTQYHAQVHSDQRGLLIRGAFDNRRLARTSGEGENWLVAWFQANDLTPDDAVDVDEVVEGYLYGVRVPGKRAVYEATEQPNDSLASIARDLDEA